MTTIALIASLGAGACAANRERPDDAATRDTFVASPPDATATDANETDASQPDATIDAATDALVAVDARAVDDAPVSDSATNDGGASSLVVSIAGGRLLRGGAPFRPRGLSMTGLAVTPAMASAAPTSVWARAQANVSSAAALDQQLTRFRSWGIDTLRFQVSQEGLDPGNSAYDASYQPLVMRTVRATVSAGFTVIVSLRGKMPLPTAVDPCPTEHLPCVVTERVWERLLADPANLGADRRVVLELYNEPIPGAPNTAASWDPWQATHQPLVDRVRAAGARNVLIVDGVRAAKFAPIDARYLLRDPANELAYGIHPYPLYLRASGLSYYLDADWDAAFGRFCTSASNVCIATEWATSSEVSCYAQDNATTPGLSSPLIAPRLLRYLAARNMGTIVWPGDYPSAIVSDYRGALTSFGPTSSFACSTNMPLYLGMGTMIRSWYTTGTLP
jgi:hypothetical protein